MLGDRRLTRRRWCRRGNLDSDTLREDVAVADRTPGSVGVVHNLRRARSKWVEGEVRAQRIGEGFYQLMQLIGLVLRQANGRLCPAGRRRLREIG